MLATLMSTRANERVLRRTRKRKKDEFLEHFTFHIQKKKLEVEHLRLTVIDCHS